jgi:hypothetical protein
MRRLLMDQVKFPVTRIVQMSAAPRVLFQTKSRHRSELPCQFLVCKTGPEFLVDALLGRHGRRRANLGIVPQRVPHSYSYVRLVRVKLHSPLDSGHLFTHFALLAARIGLAAVLRDVL